MVYVTHKRNLRGSVRVAVVDEHGKSQVDTLQVGDIWYFHSPYVYKVDSTNFPISTTIAAAIVTLDPGGLRELHWHPNAEEWLDFHQGTARATAFLGTSIARIFDLTAGDTAVFPDNSGHYIENTSDTEKLIWIELYISDRVADVSLTQWLALTPPEIVAGTLKIPRSVVDRLKKEKQLLLAKSS